MPKAESEIQKEAALKAAIELAKSSASGGLPVPLSKVLRETYQAIRQIQAGKYDD